MTPTEQYLAEAQRILTALDRTAIDRVLDELVEVKARGGRLFVLGVGGSAANASHAVNDLRKLCDIEAYAPTDNVAELTARTNDEGWDTVFAAWLKTSRLSAKDLVLVFSVGGGNLSRNISANLVRALELAQATQSRIAAVVGRADGHAATVAHACVVIPTVNPVRVTPHAEAFQSLVWHLWVSHPRLQCLSTQWEQAAP